VLGVKGSPAAYWMTSGLHGPSIHYLRADDPCTMEAGARLRPPPFHYLLPDQESFYVACSLAAEQLR